MSPGASLINPGHQSFKNVSSMVTNISFNSCAPFLVDAIASISAPTSFLPVENSFSIDLPPAPGSTTFCLNAFNKSGLCDTIAFK